MSKETWKIIPKCPNYAASTKGRIKRLTKSCGTQAGLILKQALRKRKVGGYKSVMLCHHNRKTYFVHRLVAITFLGPRPENNQVNHLNGNKSDNRLQNLEWTTQSLNMRHARDNGFLSLHRGEEHWNAKLTNKAICVIWNAPKSKDFRLKLSKQFSISRATINDIKSQRTWKHFTDLLPRQPRQIKTVANSQT